MVDLVGNGQPQAQPLPRRVIAALPDGGRADAIAVDVGPGSFTGVRIGIAAARALALAWSVPLHGYSAFCLIAAMAAVDHRDGPVAVTITGGHGELFWQLFETDGRTVFTSDEAINLEWLPRWITIIGSGYIGLEFADVYTALGCEVTMIEALDRVMPTFDPDIAKLAARHLIDGMDVHAHHPKLPLLFDPQTAGGLLAAVPADCVLKIDAIEIGVVRSLDQARSAILLLP